MRLHILRAIYEKEVLDLIRDRRTLISMVLMPVLIMPLMIVAGTRVVGIMEQKSRDDARTMPVIVRAANPAIAVALRKAGLLVGTVLNLRRNRGRDGACCR